MEASASAPVGNHIQPEPPEWQPRAIWVGGRLLCGAISFFFASFLFAFFYLKALDVNHNWKIGTVTPDGGIGIAIAALFLFSAVIYRLAARRPAGDSMAAGMIAVVMGIAALRSTWRRTIVARGSPRLVAVCTCSLCISARTLVRVTRATRAMDAPARAIAGSVR